MRFVIQRVSEASVKIDGTIYSEIQKGLLDHDSKSAQIELTAKMSPKKEESNK